MAAAAGFAVLILVVGLTRGPGVRSLFAGWALVQLYFSLFFAKFASADYLLGLIALVAIIMDWRMVLATFALGVSYFLFDQWYLVGAENFPMPDLFPFSRSVVFWMPPIAAVITLFIWLGWRRSRRPAIT
jgi:hypothetical protein